MASVYPFGASPARASHPVTPTAGTAKPKANPRAAETAMRIPVKLPGPTPTPIASRSRQDFPASVSISSSIGIKRSACPRLMGSTCSSSRWSPSSKAAAQCGPAQSKPRIKADEVIASGRSDHRGPSHHSAAIRCPRSAKAGRLWHGRASLTPSTGKPANAGIRAPVQRLQSLQWQ